MFRKNKFKKKTTPNHTKAVNIIFRKLLPKVLFLEQSNVKISCQEEGWDRLYIGSPKNLETAVSNYLHHMSGLINFKYFIIKSLPDRLHILGFFGNYGTNMTIWNGKDDYFIGCYSEFDQYATPLSLVS